MSLLSRAFAVGVVVGLACPVLLAQERRPPARARIGDMAWLAGEWIMDDKGTSVEERWTTPAAGAMLAVSRTVKGDRMVAFEYLRIVERDTGLVYVAQPGGRLPTEFVLTSLAGRTATFENPEHDFPTMIRYSLRADGSLEARVSDGARQTETFVFKRRTAAP